jgi:hypothetical protein
MSSNINNLSKQELAELIFDEELKTLVSSTLTNHYGVKSVEYRPLNYGVGIQLTGSDSFGFILGAISKVTGIAIESFGILGENKDAKTAFYAYLPEKDKSLHRRLKSRNILINKN